MTLTLQEYRPDTDVAAAIRSDKFLLLMSMGALQVEPDEVQRIESGIFRGLAEACARCESKGRCEQDLIASGAVGRDWGSYCSNAATLSALAALPWVQKKSE